MPVLPPSNPTSPCGNIGAKDGLDLGNCLTLDGTRAVKDVYENPAQLVNVVVANVFPIAGLIIMITIVVIGFKFVRSGAKGKDEARTMAQTLLMGLFVMFIAYWVIQIIEFVTGTDILF
jgi:hypothetical protein